MAPGLSVLLPAHNAAAVLEESLASLKRQSFESFAIVLVDDGSEDIRGGGGSQPRVLIN